MDISSLVFHPPSFKEKDLSSLLQPGESISFTGICDGSPKLGNLLQRYSSTPPLMQKRSLFRSEVNPVLSIASRPSPFKAYSALLEDVIPKPLEPVHKKRPFLLIRPPKSATLQPASRDLVFVLFHSNAEDIFKSVSLGRKIAEAFECTVVLPEYRGYSLLAGEKIEPEAIREDMLAVVNYLNQAMGIDFGDIVLLGKSVGSYFSSYIASRISVKASIFFMGFVSVIQIIQNKLGKFFGSLLTSYMDNSLEIKESKCPTLVIHGKKDSIIPYTQIVDLVDKCPTKPKLVLFDDMDHYRYFIFKNLVDPIDEFLVSLEQDSHCESMILTRNEERCFDEKDCFGISEEDGPQKLRSTITIQTLISKSPGSDSK